MTRGRMIAAAVSGLVLVAVVAAAVFRIGEAREAAGKAERQARAAPPARCLPASADEDDPHAGMVWVPGGRLRMGDTVYAEEGPIRERDVKGFWIDRHEVTNREFAAFVAATDYVTLAERPVDAAAHPELPPDMRKPGAVVFVTPEQLDGSEDIGQWWRYVPGANWRHPGGPDTDIEGHGNYPVVALAYDDILAYARWKGRTIPSEAQWEWAARGGRAGPVDEHAQPKEANTWQGIFPVQNSGEDGFVGLAPAGCYKPNGYGLYDMIGNVWEWTSDLYAGDRTRRVIKGGSFLCAPNYCMRYRAGARQGQEADFATSHLGFRTILEAPEP